MARCSNCKRPVAPRERNEAFPFCSPRCRALDLSRWFTGGYRVPGREEQVERPEEPKSEDER